MFLNFKLMNRVDFNCIRILEKCLEISLKGIDPLLRGARYWEVV